MQKMYANLLNIPKGDQFIDRPDEWYNNLFANLQTFNKEEFVDFIQDFILKTYTIQNHGIEPKHWEVNDEKISQWVLHADDPNLFLKDNYEYDYLKKENWDRLHDECFNIYKLWQDNDEFMKNHRVLDVIMLITQTANIAGIQYALKRSRQEHLNTPKSQFYDKDCIYNVKYTLDKDKIFSSSILKQILSIGWPGGVVSLSWQFGGTALYSILGMLPLYSTEIMAAYATGLRIESAIFMPAFAFNMANAVIVGNLMGEKKFDEAYKNGFVTAFISMTIVTVMMAVIIIFARPIAEILEPNEAVVPEIIKYLYICMIAEPFIALNLAMGGALNGAGDTKATMRYAILNVWVLRLPLAYILGIFLGFGATGIWWALNMGFFMQVILSTRRFMSKKWQKIEII